MYMAVLNTLFFSWVGALFGFHSTGAPSTTTPAGADGDDNNRNLNAPDERIA